MCKTTTCEEEVSHYNHCFELVNCGEPDAYVAMRKNASDWINQTTDCIEYLCYNHSGRQSWSNCNSSTCAEGKCTLDDGLVEEEMEVSMDVDVATGNYNSSDITVRLGEVSGDEQVKIGCQIDTGGKVARVFAVTKKREAAEIIAEVATICSDPEGDIEDTFYDEFECDDLLNNAKHVRVAHGEKVPDRFLDEAPHATIGNISLLLLLLMTIAAYM